VSNTRRGVALHGVRHIDWNDGLPRVASMLRCGSLNVICKIVIRSTCGAHR
jgi:hypothetical protein